jgi:hypothetical protein
MTTRKELLSFSDDYDLPSDEELTNLANELFVMYDKEEQQQDDPSANIAEKP